MRIAVLAVLASVVLGVSAGAVPANIAAAVSDPARPESDLKRDEVRKPAEMLRFAGVKPGMKVMDLIPVGGYFTRLFAKAVGPNGYVYGYEPVEYDVWDKKVSILAVAAQYKNVSAMHFPIAKLTAPEQLDIVWTAQNYHDLYDPFMGPADVAATNKAVFAMLKPGGVYVILDHAAPDGTGTRDTNTTHRIDEAVVKKDLLAAGFEFVGESRVLRNPTDPRTDKVWEKTIRGRTDQFILKFRKPFRSGR